jgi:hypothetical protein
VANSEELHQALSHLQQLVDRQDPDNPTIFIAPSLESLRAKIYERPAAGSRSRKLALVDSPFSHFLRSTATHKTLIIPEDLLLKAPGVSSYYPMLDSSRMLSKTLHLPADIELVVLIQEDHLKEFRLDFQSRFQVPGTLHVPPRAPELTAEGTLHEAPEAEATSITFKPESLETAKKEDLLTAVRITPLSFWQLFEHIEMTCEGPVEHPGFSNLPFLNGRSILLSGDFTKEQWTQLGQAKALADTRAEPFPQIFMTETFPESDFLRFEPLPRSAFPKKIHALRAESLSENLTVLALPEAGNPFVQFMSSDETEETETKIQFSELVTRLQAPYQTLVFYGKLTPTFQNTLASIATGTFWIGGESIRVGEGTRVLVLQEDRHAETEPAPPPAGAGAGSGGFQVCDIIEGSMLEDEKTRLLTPWETRLAEFSGGKTSILEISAFDLMNPSTQLECRNLVNSALGGQILIQGTVVSLSKDRQVRVYGEGLPSSIRKLAQAFDAYLKPQSPRLETVKIDPNTLPIDDDTRRLQDERFRGSTLFLTDSRRKLLHAIQAWLNPPRSASEDHPLFLIEGPSGVGKSSVLREYLKPLEERGEVVILVPHEQLIQDIAALNREGKIVFIDEFNTLKRSEIEAIEALVRSGPSIRIIGTQNPTSFQHRVKLSPDLLAHSMQYFLDEYPHEELLEICEHHGLSRDVAEFAVEQFEAEQRQKTATFRSFLGTLPKIKAAAEDPTFFDEAPASAELPLVATVLAPTTRDPHALFLACLRGPFEGHYEQIFTLLGLRDKEPSILKEAVVRRLECLRGHPQLSLTLQALENPSTLLAVIAWLKTGTFNPHPSRGRLKRLLALKTECESQKHSL